MHADLEAIRDTIKHTGEVRFHILYSRSNLTVTCRMWHYDGVVLGRANGGGYDRAGAALGQAIEKLFPEELKGLVPGYDQWRDKDNKLQGAKVEGGLYGLTKLADGRMSLDGSCGRSCMMLVIAALGFDDCTVYNTGPASEMVLGRRSSAQISKLKTEIADLTAQVDALRHHVDLDREGT